MTITMHLVHKIADSAKLNLDNETADLLAKQLENILTLTEKMSSVDTSQISPVSHFFETSLPLREDQVTEQNQRDVLQKNSPQTEAGLFLVPKVIE